VAITGIQAASEALKSYFLPSLRYQLNEQASPTLTQFERDSQSVVGKDIVMALRYGRSGGVGMRLDTGDLPEANSRKTRQAKWETKNVFARIMLSDKVIRASRSNVGAFANLLEQELEDAQNDAKDMLSRQLFGDGSGLLATVQAVDATNKKITVDNVDYFAEGQFIDIYNGDALVLQKAEILGVDPEARVLTLSDVTGVLANHSVYMYGNKGLELTGFKAVFQAPVLYGIDRAQNPWLKARRINVNGEISEVVIQQAIDLANKDAGSNTNLLVCSFGVRRAYQYLLSAQKRQVNTLELRGGWKALEYNGIGLVPEKYCPAGTMFCLDSNDWKMYEMADWDWLDEGGGILHPVSGKAAFEAVLVKYCDLGCQKPRGQVELYGITEH